MRVLHVNPFLYRRGRVEAYMQDVAALQRAAGHDVEFFAVQHPENMGRVQAAGRLVWSTTARRGMASVVETFRPDVVHLHNIYHQLSPSILRPLAHHGVAAVMTLHEYKLACPSYRMLDAGAPCRACIGGGLSRPVRHRCKDRSLPASALVTFGSWLHSATGAYGHVSRFVCPSRFMADTMAEADVFPERMRWIPHFVDVTASSPDGPPGGPVVFAGRLAPEKGLDTLISAVGLTGIPLLVAGDGPARAASEALADRLAPGLVTFLGRVSRDSVLSLFRSAVAVAVPSVRFENQPMVVLEAMVCGAPVVGTIMGGLPELIDAGTDGELVPPGDAGALGAALEKLADDPIRARHMGLAGREKVLRDFAPDLHLSRLDVVYAEAVAATGNHGALRRGDPGPLPSGPDAPIQPGSS